MQLEYIEDLLKTRKIRKNVCRTKQTIRDRKSIDDRLTLNGIKVDYVDAYLCKLAGCHVTIDPLLEFAYDMSYQFRLKLDRLAKRNRTALLCWYAENWGNIFPYLSKIKFHETKIIKEEKKIMSESSDESGPEVNSIPAYCCDAINIDPSDLAQLVNYH
ncbi:hypothetical protein TVAGG3_0681770 [Trichomonas vaginalis G3]|uniref:hypothetical protein n=1 Tax=Trichomonas vaginalis (strain ATCC PRA-98 / G3) TaxID=412133 RepID=UPI0021E613CA|nr:hypothetical protein TVAGG3_0681770 [Trichomonas vaginalis G3]KAI5507966.1 hypothetical protein TVAGG3_0681770 [Trichomonas vaginalis G3]